MSVDINPELGIKISSAVLPSVAFPRDQDSLVHVDANTGDVFLLSGHNHFAQRTNDVVFDSLKEGLRAIDQKKNNPTAVLRQMTELFMQNSQTIRSTFPNERAGTSAIAMKFMRPAGEELACLWAHMGTNRFYHLDEKGVIHLRSVMKYREHSYDFIIPSYNRHRFLAMLDTITTAPELLNSDRQLQGVWENMSNPPYVYLGSQIDQEYVEREVTRLIEGERILLTTVGVHRSLRTQKMIDILLSGEQDPAQVLVERAKAVSSQKQNFRATPQQSYGAIVAERI